MRALRAILALTIACTTALALPSLAAAASGGACVNSPETYQTGDGRIGVQLDGVKAVIDPAGGYFYPCSELNNDSSASAWVAIEEWAGSPSYSEGIIQIGIVNCGFFGPSYCDGNATQPHYFWAKNGCGFPADVQDLGVANWNAHTYEINQQSGNNNMDLKIDGVIKKTILSSDVNYYCWANHLTNGTFAGERHNRGDSLGSSGGTQLLKFTSAQTRLNGGSFALWNIGTCAVIEPASGTGRSFCSGGNGWMNIYTVY